MMAEAITDEGGVLRARKDIPDAVWLNMGTIVQQGIRDELEIALIEEAARRELTIVSSPLLSERHDEDGCID